MVKWPQIGLLSKTSDKPVGMHFNTPGHTFDDLTVMIIEQMRVASVAHRKSREHFWIHTLPSLTPLASISSRKPWNATDYRIS